MRRQNCRLCKSADLAKFLELGPQPLAGGFLAGEQLKQKEEFYPLGVYFCNNCSLVQVLDVVPKDTLFSKYFYAPHSLLSPHFTKYAEQLREEFGLDKDSLVVEFGSNIGMMLKPFKDMGIKAIGVEPAENIAKIANGHGLETIVDFFNEKAAKRIAGKHGKADIIVANNVFAHIDNLDEVMAGIRALLKDNGVYVFENHYLVDTLEKMQYDDIYHEHLCYYALHPLMPFLERHGLLVFDARRIDTHGGSIRVYCSNSGRETNARVGELLRKEKELGVHKFGTFEVFGRRVEKHGEELGSLLRSFRKQGKTIVGYGAPARGNTLLNYCKIGIDVLDFIIDDSPLRQNKYTPGTRIPIFGVEKFREKQPDYALLLAYGGYTESILKKEQAYIDNGGKFIIPLPKIRIESG